VVHPEGKGKGKPLEIVESKPDAVVDVKLTVIKQLRSKLV